MRSLSTKAFFAILAATVVVVLLIGAIFEYAQERTQLRIHAAAETGGDPRRGESMFIQYGCGSCHALKNVRTATGAVGPPLDGIATRVIIGGGLSKTPPHKQRRGPVPPPGRPGAPPPPPKQGGRG